MLKWNIGEVEMHVFKEHIRSDENVCLRGIFKNGSIVSHTQRCRMVFRHKAPGEPVYETELTEKRFTVEHMEELYAGIRLACEIYGVDIIGGDTCASHQGLIISITCIGEAGRGNAVRRSGAKPTDIICVSGDLGAAYMGLQLLEREKIASAGRKDFEPDFAGKEYIVERQLKPEARRDVVEALAKAGIKPTSMMDISDGLSSELLHICKQSGVGCRVYEERIPIDYQTALMAEELNMNLVTAALNGGEDYELLFTIPLSAHDKISELPGVREIGYITEESKGCALVGRDGQSEIPLRAQGWNPLAEN